MSEPGHARTAGLPAHLRGPGCWPSPAFAVGAHPAAASLQACHRCTGDCSTPAHPDKSGRKRGIMPGKARVPR